jgi:hypothetical protein
MSSDGKSELIDSTEKPELYCNKDPVKTLQNVTTEKDPPYKKRQAEKKLRQFRKVVDLL